MHTDCLGELQTFWLKKPDQTPGRGEEERLDEKILTCHQLDHVEFCFTHKMFLREQTPLGSLALTYTWVEEKIIVKLCLKWKDWSEAKTQMGSPPGQRPSHILWPGLTSSAMKTPSALAPEMYILCLGTQISSIPAIPINTLLSFVWPPRFRRLLWSKGLVRQDLLSLKVAGFCDESFLTIGKAGFDCSGAFTSIFGADPTLFQGLRVPVFSLRATVLGWIRQRQPTDRHMAGDKGGPRREDWRMVELVYWFLWKSSN